MTDYLYHKVRRLPDEIRRAEEKLAQLYALSVEYGFSDTQHRFYEVAEGTVSDAWDREFRKGGVV